ncbi:hypothetical protein ASF57_12245 [Methylobacterium sp. Leaf117]|nr:hypothetical protein ASF57_12245 [Methylobacterium sp. Leaf117]
MITGDGGAQTLNGKAGNDILTGRGGADIFVIAKGEGSDIITDFASGVDKVRMEGVNLHSFAELKMAASQVGSDTVIALGGGETLTLQNVALTNLKAGDFALPADPSHPGMTLSFADEFNTLSASANGQGTVWKSALGVGTSQDRTLGSNHEAQYYSDSSVGTNPFSVSNGVLSITAAPDHDGNPLGLAYTSGVLTTAKSFAQTYGYFEMRAELPAGQGMWPAFWLLNADGTWPAELDVLEFLGHDKDTAYATAHSSIGGHTLTSMPVQTEDLTEGFHTFGVNWQKDTLEWYIDGAKVAETATPADMHKPMYMVVNLAVGDTGSWPGKYDASMPTTMAEGRAVGQIAQARRLATPSGSIGRRTRWNGTSTVRRWPRWQPRPTCTSRCTWSSIWRWVTPAAGRASTTPPCRPRISTSITSGSGPTTPSTEILALDDPDARTGAVPAPGPVSAGGLRLPVGSVQRCARDAGNARRLRRRTRRSRSGRSRARAG